jgi:hypothetical protein
MSADEVAGGRLLKGGGRDGRSNSVWLVGDAVLKLYRRRRSWLREVAGEAAAWFFHRKRGVSVGVRHETERRSLEVWRGHGFDVPAMLARPLPDGVTPPALWMEYCPGPLLYDAVDAGRLERLGASMDRRHRLALETREPLLVHEKGTLKHVIVCGDRLVTFDFEQGFRRSFPMREALAEEVAGYLRSLAQATEESHVPPAFADGTNASRPEQATAGERPTSDVGTFEDGVKALLRGYSDTARLKRIAEWGTRGVSFYRLMKRWQDGVRRPVHGKVDVLRRLLAMLG